MTNTRNNTNRKITLDSLKIIQINVNSIVTNERRVTLLDTLTKHNPDIVLLSETKLNHTHRINFQDYHILRTDRFGAKQAGGTGILIRKTISFESIEPNSIKNNICLETTIIKIKTQNNCKIYIVAAYAAKKKEFISELKNLFTTLELDKSNNYYLIAGDLNAKHTSWGNVSNNERGVYLNKWYLDNQITYKTSLLRTAVPSFPSSGAFIDLCLADNRIKFHDLPASKALDSFNYDSDHRAAILKISIPAFDHLEIDEPHTTAKYNFNKADWTKYKISLIENDDTDIPNNRNLTKTEIDVHIDKLNQNITKAIDFAVPRVNNNFNSTDRYINPKIKKLRKQKSHLLTHLNNLLRLQNYTTANDTLIKTLKQALKTIRYEIRKAFQESVNNFWKNKIANISLNKPKELFPSINSIFRPKEYNTIGTLKVPTFNRDIFHKANINLNNLQTDTHNNALIYETQDKLNILGAHFETVHTQNSHMGKEQHSNIIKRKIETLKQEIERDILDGRTTCSFTNTNTADNPNPETIPSNYFTSYNKLKITFKSLNNKKSSSFDGIPNIALKNLPHQYIVATV
ncbi:uncharacterized protein LOC143341343 [Colletes latitarsis]|uniref:uncharacterized protein LOC143341343 n=1 Tax=Colletes latitarsis TaxID=2605962 RepID=UPI0040365849